MYEYDDKINIIRHIRDSINSNIYFSEYNFERKQAIDKLNYLIRQVVMEYFVLKRLTEDRQQAIKESKGKLISTLIKIIESLNNYLIKLTKCDMMRMPFPQITVTKEALKKMMHTELLVTAKAIFNVMQKYSDNVLIYNLTHEQLKYLEKCIKWFWEAINYEEEKDSEYQLRERKLKMYLDATFDFMKSDIRGIIEPLKDKSPDLYFNIKLSILLFDMEKAIPGKNFNIPVPSMN